MQNRPDTLFKQIARDKRILTFKRRRLGSGRLGNADYAPELLGAWTFMH